MAAHASPTLSQSQLTCMDLCAMLVKTCPYLLLVVGHILVLVLHATPELHFLLAPCFACEHVGRIAPGLAVSRKLFCN
eukprot:scaffold60869_cov20-Tisochrysis_lutea.AAC.1